MLGVWFVVMRPLQGKNHASLKRLICKIVTYSYRNGEYYRNVTSFGPSVSKALLPDPLSTIHKVGYSSLPGELQLVNIDGGKEKVELLNHDPAGKYWAIEYLCTEDNHGSFIEDIWVMSRWTDAQTYDLKDAYWYLYHIHPELASMGTSLEYPTCINRSFQWKTKLKLWKPRPKEIVNDRNVETARARFWEDVKNGKESAATAEELKSNPEMFETYLRKKVVERNPDKRLHDLGYFRYYNPKELSINSQPPKVYDRNRNVYQPQIPIRPPKTKLKVNLPSVFKSKPPPPSMNEEKDKFQRNPRSMASILSKMLEKSGLRTRREMIETPIDSSFFQELYESVVEDIFSNSLQNQMAAFAADVSQDDEMKDLSYFGVKDTKLNKLKKENLKMEENQEKDASKGDETSHKKLEETSNNKGDSEYEKSLVDFDNMLNDVGVRMDGNLKGNPFKEELGLAQESPQVPDYLDSSGGYNHHTWREYQPGMKNQRNFQYNREPNYQNVPQMGHTRYSEYHNIQYPNRDGRYRNIPPDYNRYYMDVSRNSKENYKVS